MTHRDTGDEHVWIHTRFSSHNSFHGIQIITFSLRSMWNASRDVACRLFTCTSSPSNLRFPWNRFFYQEDFFFPYLGYFQYANFKWCWSEQLNLSTLFVVWWCLHWFYNIKEKKIENLLKLICFDIENNLFLWRNLYKFLKRFYLLWFKFYLAKLLLCNC